MIAYTRGSAFAEFAEKEKGTLAPGMLADLALLSQEIFTIPVDQLPATGSVMTTGWRQNRPRQRPRELNILQPLFANRSLSGDRP